MEDDRKEGNSLYSCLQPSIYLGKVYESLLRQTDERFSWLIVDDGSTDNTEELVNMWMQEKRIEIIYFKQDNQGKPIAAQ